MAEPLHIAFLGCGFITRVHSQHLKGGAVGNDRPELREPRSREG